MNAPAAHQPLAPGLHTEAAADPLAHAGRLAGELGADVCATPQEVDALLLELDTFPRLSLDTLADLRRLATRVAAAQRVVDRTVDRAAVEVGARLSSTGTGMAIHPSAVRDRAAAFVSAREALLEAEERLLKGEAEAESASALAEPPLPPPPPPPPRVEPLQAEPRRRRRLLPLRPRATEQSSDDEYERESTLLLQQVAASTDEAFGARRASAARDDHVVLLRAQRDRAQEEVRVAERAWRDLAGDYEVDEVEVVVRRFDPQYQEAVAVAHDTAGVRAASVLLERAIADWDIAWRALGIESSTAPDAATVVQMADRLVRPVVLVAAAAAHAELVVIAAPAAPVVVIEGAS